MDDNLLAETASDYIEKFEKRLSNFLEEFEADEIDFIDNQIQFFENTIELLENPEIIIHGYYIEGAENYQTATEIIDNIGWKKFYYSTQKKIKFLNSKKTTSSLPTQSSYNNLTIIQLALIHIYNGVLVTRENAEFLLASTKHKAKYSGESLYQDYNALSKIKARQKDEGTLQLNQNKINRIKSILEFITFENRKNAEKDITVLEKIVNTYYL